MPKEIVSSQSPAEIVGQAAQPAEVPALSIQLAPVVPVPEPLPQAGGSYVRTESGELRRVEQTEAAPSSLVVEPSEQTGGQ